MALILILFLLVVLAILANNADQDRPIFKKRHCEVHSWSFNHFGKFQCTKCDFIAGTHDSDNGEY